MDILKAQETAKKLAVEAGNLIMEIYETDFEVDYKKDESPLTIADKKANDLIIKGLKSEFPDVGILSEENEDDESIRLDEYIFIVDPLDGTKEFVKRNGEFTVNIALAKNSHTIMGVIYLPVKNEIYYAVKGNGAYLEKNAVIKEIKVTDISDQIRVVMSKSHMGDKEKALVRKYKDKISNIVQAGSSLKGCMVAKGDAEVYYRFGYTCEWDTAAMQAICEEAGAIFKQMDDTDMIYNRNNHLNEKGFYIINNTLNKLNIK